MESKKGKKFIYIALAAILVLFGVNYVNKKASSNEEKGKNVIDSIFDSIYDAFDNGELEIEEVLTENEELTAAMLSNELKLNSDEELIAFYKQLEIQTDEYTDIYYKEKAKSSINLYNEMMIDFIVRGKENRGYFYQSLSIYTQKEILDIAINIQYMNDHGYPKRKEGLKEYEATLHKVLRNWIGVS